MKNNIKGVQSYFNPNFLMKVKTMGLFFLLYTLLFFGFTSIFRYTIPIIIALIIALLLNPLKTSILHLSNKSKYIKISNSFVSLLLTILVLLIMVFIIFGVGFKLFIEFESFLLYITDKNTIEIFSNSMNSFISSIDGILNNIDPTILAEINNIVSKLVSTATSIMTVFVQQLLKLAISLPSLFITTFITIIITYFFIKDIDQVKYRIKNVFSGKGIRFLIHLKKGVHNLFTGYIKAYLFIMLGIFITSFIIFTIIGIEYALPLSLVTAVLDALPIFGAGFVFGILILINYFDKKVLVAIMLIIGYIIIVIIRQLLEQKLVSSFLGIHPLVILGGLLIALTPLGFKGMFYFIGIFILFKVLDSSVV